MDLPPLGLDEASHARVARADEYDLALEHARKAVARAAHLSKVARRLPLGSNGRAKKEHAVKAAVATALELADVYGFEVDWGGRGDPRELLD